MNDASLADNPFAARYARDFAASPRNAVIDTLLAHRSWRAFKPDPLPAGTLETLIAAGQSAATSSNMQTWSVVAVEDPARRAELLKLGENQKQILEAPLVLCFVADLSRLAAIADRINHKRAGLDYLELFMVAAIDSALAAQNVCVAAESLALGTCYLGVLRNHPEEVAAFLKLPPMAAVTFGLAIGFPDPKRPANIKPRLAQGSVLHRETYDAAQALAPVADYEVALDAFNKRERNGQPLWGLRSSARVAGPESLSGRDRLKFALRQLGFPLL
ncbi:NADPH-dependent oxidoreductase [Terrarubrum flagellatum]|uniref:NADPH-dependent oxidoreductase n=1 Tax=Terrirubrum flagellatum TaxID=2895980 RepID=UPI0031456D82